ncbi:MAG: HD domain-containing protein [Deltaproteobacteria bacterium]|nr:MAG: HD domain-containing protein [Deltaproteobacteria bacterium]
MKNVETIRPVGQGKGRFSPGIRMKLFGFLLPLVFLLIVTVAWAVTGITDFALRRDLLQRGAAISRVVALSAGYSLLSNDRLGMDRLAAETRASAPDIAFVLIRDAGDVIVAHDRVGERGKPFEPSARQTALGTFSDTRADEVIRGGRTLMEFNTPIRFAGKNVGTATLALTTETLAAAHRSIHRAIIIAASVILGLAFFGTLLLASLITTPVKRLHDGVLSLGRGEGFRPIPEAGTDELADLTRNFNRMAETILAQKSGLEKQARQLEEAYIGMVRVIAASLDARDPYTLGHSTRVARLSCELGRRLGMDEAELTDLERAAIFHDLGKIQTPDDVLRKEERLSRDEEERMRSHPTDGTDILRMAPFLHRYIPVVRAHHEWYNGEGYPDGKKGDDIPLHAQIIALADAFDAMTTDRPYRQALDTEDALEEILRFSGTQFSPSLAGAFAKMVRELPPADESTLKSMAL